ncbi:MAG: tetratricopeptide repeat protein [Acidimicrobiales bacterium]
MSTSTTTPTFTPIARDQHGLTIAATVEAAELYDRAVDRLLRYHPDLVPLATQLSEEHGDVAMSNAFVAYLHLSSTARNDVDVARAAWEAMAATPMGPREQAHHDAIGAWVQGDWHGAGRILDELLERWPADLLALMYGHLLDFFVGDAANLRDRPGRSLTAFDPAHPHAAFVRGMQAFGLEESGHYEDAEDAGLAAIAVNPDDVWAIHAVTHTYEMRGRVATGVEFLTSREHDWGSGNLFTVHNWWHLALFHLELGDPSAALAIYDREVHHEASDSMVLQLLDAAALLWRLHLDGIDTGGRFATLADAWSTADDARRWYAFNDVHATLAYVGAGRIDDAERLIERIARYVNGDAHETAATRANVAMTAEIGLPASQALVAYGKGDWPEVVAQLAPIRRRLQHFGGSHAQRDVLQRTLLEAALRDGRFDLARGLVAERLAVRPTSAYAARQNERLVASASGRPA